MVLEVGSLLIVYSLYQGVFLLGMIKSESITNTIEYADGTTESTHSEKTTAIKRNDEPDFIKLYTKMWCEFNNIPDAYRNLFLELVARMTYCNSCDLDKSQLVNTGKPWSDGIMKALHWKNAMYQRGLKALCDCNAIKKINRGVYQINPQYAGKGEWKYNPRLNRGGVEDLIAVFKFKDKKVETQIVWADDGTDHPMNEMYREALNVQPSDDAALKTTSITDQKPNPIDENIAV